MTSAEPLPRGVHGLDRETVLRSQRARMLNGIVRAVAEKGYGATRVEDVTRLARVSRTTFYEQFADKEDCFAAAYEAGARAHFDYVSAAVAQPEGRVEQLRAGTRAYVEALAADPASARTFLSEVHAAGPRALALRAEAHRRYAEVLRAWHEAARDELGGVPDLPLEVFMASVAAVDEIVAGRIRAGRANSLHELAPTLVYLQLALFGMGEAARAELGR